MSNSNESDFPAPVLPTTRRISPGWARVGLVTWIAVLLSNIAVGVTSRTVGKPPWWLGPSVDPAPIVFVALPLLLVATPLIFFYRSSVHAPRIAMGCACAMSVVALADLGETPGVAVVEIAIALAALMGSIATNAGVFTRP